MTFSVRFLPENRTWRGEEPTDLFLAAAACEILVEQPCGSKTICGKCRVRVVEDGAPPALAGEHVSAPPTMLPEGSVGGESGALSAGSADVRVLGAGAVAEGWRLGCQLQLDGDAVIEIPPVARAVAAKSFGDDALVEPGFEPPVRRVRVAVAPADDSYQWRSGRRLADALGSDETTLVPTAAVLRQLASALDHGGLVEAVLDEGRLVVVRAGETTTAPERSAGSEAGRGIAIDVGSTTLAVALVDLATGTVEATASQLNPQVRWGGDIISRIHAAGERPGTGKELHDSLVRVLNGLIGDCTESTDVSLDDIVAMSCVGNPTMLHTLLDLDIAPLGQAPYVGVWQSAWRGAAGELGLEPELARAYLLPGIRSHVGADTVAAIVAAGMDRAAGLRLLIDLGTNSELALGSRDGIVCTSTSAGPAFEGANIHHGMRGAPGAIDQLRVRPTGSIMVHAIAGEAPVGICGSGLIDVGAELVRVGVVEPSGRMRLRAELEGMVPSRLRERLLEVEGVGRAVWLAGSQDRPVLLTAGDIRQLQLVKASISAGMATLLDHFGATIDDLEEVLIAGAFGNYVRKTSAQAIGLVPAVDPERIRFIGNAAGAGARLTLVDRRARVRAERVAATSEYIELAGRPDYQDRFVAAIPFPAAGEVTWMT